MVAWNTGTALGTTFSGGNLTTTSTGFAVGVANTSYSTGDISFEATFTNATGAGTTGIGFMSGSASLAAIHAGAAYVGSDNLGISFFDDGVVYFNGAALASLTPPVAGDRVAVRWRLVAGGFYRRIFHSGAWGDWNDNPSANPLTDTGGISTAGITGSPYYPAYEIDPSSGAITTDFSALSGGASYTFGGASTGLSAATLSDSAKRPLAGSSTGLSTASASLIRRTQLLGSAAGVAATSGLLVRRAPMAGGSTGTSTTTGAMNRKAPFGGTSTGSSTATMNDNARRPFGGTSSGSSSTSGDLVGGADPASGGGMVDRRRRR